MRAPSRQTVRLYGKKALTIDHQDYSLNGARAGSESATAQGAFPLDAGASRWSGSRDTIEQLMESH
jgi:hypothetical protein